MEYEVIKSSRKTLAIEVKSGKITVRAPIWASDADIDSFIQKNREWIEKQLKKQEDLQNEKKQVQKLSYQEIEKLADKAVSIIPDRVKYYARKIGVSYGRITIRNQRSRWGSCSVKGNLNFNCLLMLAPEEVLDSVVVHELCHRKYMNHSDKFYEEVLKVYPNYWECYNWLKNNGGILMAMMEP